MKPCLFNCDWLAITCRCATDRRPEDLSVCPIPGMVIIDEGGTKVWKKRYTIQDTRGLKWMTMLMQPLSSIIPPGSVLIEVSNHVLYRPNSEVVIAQLMSIIHLKAVSVSRVDFCCDFECDDACNEVIEGLVTKTIVRAGRHHKVVWDHPADGGNKVHCINWGKPETAVKWKLYDKSFEVFTSTGECLKPYIVAQWAAMKFDCRRVWRLEVSVHQLRRLDCDVSSTWFSCLQYSEAWFRCLYAKYFVLKRPSTTDVNRSRWQTVRFLDVDSDQNVRFSKPKTTSVITEDERTLMKSMARLVKSGARGAVVNAIAAALGSLSDDGISLRDFMVTANLSTIEFRTCFPTILKGPSVEDAEQQNYLIDFGEPRWWRFNQYHEPVGPFVNEATYIEPGADLFS